MEFIKQALIDVDYPYIHTLRDDEIENLFESANISKFFRWYVGELISNEEELDTYTDTDVIDFICNYGYCSASQKDALHTGTLNYQDQFDIICHMLSNLAIFKKHETIDESAMPAQNVSLQELNDLITQKLDLFPAFNGKKSYTDEERADQVISLEDQIKELEERCADLSNAVSNEEETVTDDKKAETQSQRNKKDMATSIDRLLMCTAKITDLESDIKKDKEAAAGRKLSDQFYDKLSDYCADAGKLEEYFESLKIVDGFDEKNTVVEDVEESTSVSAVDKLLKLTELM